MTFPDDAARPRLSRAALILTLPAALAACSLLGGEGAAVASTPAAAAPRGTGPEADYPLITGEPYVVAGTQYKPEDVMNYDAVGYLAADSAGGSAISGAHHTLPLPSYVEVTSLESGRTILVRLERRGPLTSNALLALSPGALAQLGGNAGSPVRVRRVNPPEDQRTVLRQGQPVALRMDTPMSLVAVLKRKLPAAGAAPVAQPAPAVVQAASAPRPAQTQMPAQAPDPAPAQAQTPAPAPILPPLSRPAPMAQAALPAAHPAPRPVTQPTSAAPVATAPVATEAARPAAIRNGFVVQAAAFASAANARKVANAIGGSVSRAGTLWRVRTGPFATRNAAEASLAKVRAAGYSDARIFTSG